ncbi:putative harbinger transposase-derived nuclease domain-containing protein [Helianthus annuus]|nr:putative harbinger transposase-derived nuclease domain-containing protein [Helianthus annuus]
MRAPRGPKETFNYHHSALRNIIERTFGVWKARWALLRDIHVNYTYEHQVSIVITSMAIHNFVKKPLTRPNKNLTIPAVLVMNFMKKFRLQIVWMMMMVCIW